MPKQRKNYPLFRQIAQVVINHRKIKGVQRDQAEEETQISFGRIERARTNISIVTLAIICDYFEISLKDFFAEVAEI